MSNSQLPLNDTDFWWLRYFLGVAVPLFFTCCGVCSLVTEHSYTYQRRLGLVPVSGEQAILMGVSYLGIALALFAQCYAQYHDKMGFYYERFLVPGIIMAGVGYFWCACLFI